MNDVVVPVAEDLQEPRRYFFEDLKPGMSAVYVKTVTDADVVGFAEVSGDHNPIHLDEEFAKTTRFGGRIAHGLLTASFISTVIGTQLPGPGSIYLSQDLKFLAPVRIGDEVTVEVKVKELFPEKKRAVFETVCRVGETVVIKGEALALVPSRG